MKSIKICSLITMLLMLTTCTKFGKNITVKGRVLNPITGEGIAGVEINLLRETVGQLPGGFKKIKSVKSDENGYYVLDKLTLSSPVVQVNFPGTYYSIGWWDGEKYSTFTNILAKRGKVTNMDYHLVPYGNIIIYIKNISCFDNNDNVKLYFKGDQYDSYTFNPGFLTELTGCVDILDNPIKSSMGYKYFHWEATKNGITTIYYDTILVNENQTTTLNVFY